MQEVSLFDDLWVVMLRDGGSNQGDLSSSPVYFGIGPGKPGIS